MSKSTLKRVKIIFLDVDGVLNSMAGTYKRQARLGRKGDDSIYEDHVDVLKWIIEYTDAKIVVSSTWRLHAGIEGMQDYLEPFGISRETIIGVTPSVFEEVDHPTRPGYRKYRGEEIHEWFERTKDQIEVESFVILDDESDMTRYIKNLVKTKYDYGLTHLEGANAICQLNGWYTDEGEDGYPAWGEGQRVYDTIRLLNIKETES